MTPSHVPATPARKPLISLVTPCYNEEANVDELHKQIADQMAKLPGVDYEHIFIDNASTDGTVAKIKALIVHDQRVRLIVNARNFGHIRSPIHGILQASGDAVMLMASDLQDPPALIPKFIEQWQAGLKVVIGVKPTSRETVAMFLIRRFYYLTIGRISDVPLIPNFTGFGLYDRNVIEHLRRLKDPYPYFRGLIADLGLPYASIPFEQPKRVRGITKNNFYTLFDMAMLGVTSYSKLPLRLATMSGFAMACFCMLIAFGYLIAKLIFWGEFNLGVAPIVIGFFFFTGIQLFFTGLLGEYIGSIHTTVRNHPHVIELERINFKP
jgi:polyisoprenyl-phosphate glycosyltransferase